MFYYYFWFFLKCFFTALTLFYVHANKAHCCFHILGVTLVNLASIHLICFTFKSRTKFSPCLKHANCTERVGNRIPSHLQFDIQFFHHSSVLLDKPIQFSSFTRLQRAPCHRKLSEQPSTLRKVASFACKMSNSLNSSLARSRLFEWWSRTNGLWGSLPK